MVVKMGIMITMVHEDGSDDDGVMVVVIFIKTRLHKSIIFQNNSEYYFII